jgi:REP element-mobilizing transposase RayT
MVTAGTYQKQQFFNTPALLTELTNTILQRAEMYGWNLQAWAIFPNHYHFLAEPHNPNTLPRMIREIHSLSAHHLNKEQHPRSKSLVPILGYTNHVSPIIPGTIALRPLQSSSSRANFQCE